LILRGEASTPVHRAFPDSARLRVTNVDATHFRLKILATPPPARGQGLTDDERRLYVEGEGTPTLAALRATARDITGGLTTAWEKARAVVDWVHKEMTYEITPREIDDVTLLHTLHGDCTEYAQLTVALLRALGVPARQHTGLLLDGPVMVAHAWVDFHDGLAWHEVDPTMGRTSVDAAYVDASVIDLLPLLSGGRLEITGVE